jgi:hypothetical protein
MKYLITESQLDKAVFIYLNSQDFIQIDIDGSIYFVNSENDIQARIRYNKDDGWCFIYYKLIEDISSFFSLQEYDCVKVISRWVENTLQMKVIYTDWYGTYAYTSLRIPSK